MPTPGYSAGETSRFDLSRVAPGQDLVAVGGDLHPATLLDAYTRGLFPMGLGQRGGKPMGWWSPDPRGILRLDQLRVSRSLRRSVRRFDVSVDQAFHAVVQGCADDRRERGWITPRVARAYERLHRQGRAHSVEVWSDGRLTGGLYGVAIGGLFAGESMFHLEPDASKVALVALVELLGADGDARRLLDVQWRTPHLASLGATEVARPVYLQLLKEALLAPLPAPWR
ncbi:MAG: leucyl/phenylalanyl-tRNA--protein transferase [Dermatophilaceae bacterium]